MIEARKDLYTVRNMYTAYISHLDNERSVLQENLTKYYALRNKVKCSIEQKRNAIDAIYDVCLYDYWQWNTDEYDENHKMQNAIVERWLNLTVTQQAKYLTVNRMLNQYFKLVERIQECELRIIQIDKFKKLKSREYGRMLARYYDEVTRQVLRGMIYKFGHRIGCLLVERIKSKPLRKPKVDYYRTRIAKQKLLEEGKHPYSRQEHLDAIVKGIPYDGVKYVVHKEYGPFFCRMIMIDGKIKNRTLFRFEITNSHTPETKEEILSRCKTVEDIINLPYDPNLKLRLITTFDPSYTLKYIRNDEQLTIFTRNYYRTARQRLQHHDERLRAEGGSVVYGCDESDGDSPV